MNVSEAVATPRLTGNPMQLLFAQVAQELLKGRAAFAREYLSYPLELFGV